MRLPVVPADLPAWPPLLATRGPGARSASHAHHAMHLVAAVDGELRVQAGTRWRKAAGVLTAPDIPHAIDADGTEVFLVFIEPESDVGQSLRATLPGPLRLLTPDERLDLLRGAAPLAIMGPRGTEWTRRAVERLGGAAVPSRRMMHPRVRKVLSLLRTAPPGETAGLEALAAQVGLSAGRLMHAFTESIGLPLRPYLAWLKLQRAAGAITSGLPLSQAAQAAGFADAAHMTRTFRRMLGTPPSELRPLSPSR